MGFVQRAFLAAAVGAVALTLVGCGSSGKLLSASESAQLTHQLNNVKLALDDHECSTARDALYQFEDRLNQLSGVNSTLVSNLDQGASTIEDLTSTACAVETPPTHTHTHTTRTASTPATTTVTTDTYPTQTYTQPTITTETYPTQSYTSTTGGTPVAPQITDTSTTPSNGGQGLSSGSSSYGSTGSTGSYTTPDTSSTTSSGGDSQGSGSTDNSQGAGGF